MQKNFCAIQFLILTFAFFIGSADNVLAQNMVIDPEACSALVKHVPSADTNYTPGVDVHGNPVAPADLPSSNPVRAPNPINILLTTDLAQKFGIKAPPGIDTNAVIGVVSADSSGNVTFNGQPVTDEQQDNLAVLCLGH